MSLIVLLIGAFFAVEGALNIWWWGNHGDDMGEIWAWQLGRLLRTLLGLTLIFIAVK